MEALYHQVNRQTGPARYLSHCDCYSPNFLIGPKGRMSLIDWEYSGAADYGVDIGTFVCCSDYTPEETDRFLNKYHGGTDGDRFHDYAYI